MTKDQKVFVKLIKILVVLVVSAKKMLLTMVASPVKMNTTVEIQIQLQTIVNQTENHHVMNLTQLIVPMIPLRKHVTHVPAKQTVVDPFLRFCVVPLKIPLVTMDQMMEKVDY